MVITGVNIASLVAATGCPTRRRPVSSRSARNSSPFSRTTPVASPSVVALSDAPRAEAERFRRELERVGAAASLR